MEPVYWLVIAWLILFGLFYLWKKSIIKAMFYTSLVFTIFTVIFGILVYHDVMDIKENILQKEKLFILLDDDIPIAAFTAKDVQTEMPKFLTVPELQTVKEDYASKKYDSIKNPYYKTFVTRLPAIESHIPDVIEYDTYRVDSDFVLELLRSENSRDKFSDMIMAKLDLGDTPIDAVRVEQYMREAKAEVISQLGDDAQFKAQVFAMVFTASLQEEGPILLVQFLHDGDFFVMPETIAFKMIKIIPLSLVEEVSKKMGETL